MTLDDALERLADLPHPLPEPPAVLMPVLADGGERPAMRLADLALTPAAVLVLIVPDTSGQACVVLIERPTYDGHHSGEVSFPGGKAEPGDADPVATALREAAEEIGLDPEAAAVEVLGRLDPVPIPVSGYRIVPVVAVARRRPAFVASPIEVVRIVQAPLDAFVGEDAIRVVERTIREWELRFGVYPVEGVEVWGATARILGQLGAVLGGGGSGSATEIDARPSGEEGQERTRQDR